MKQRILNLLSKHKKRAGARILSFLYENRKIEFSYLQLYQLVKQDTHETRHLVTSMTSVNKPLPTNHKPHTETRNQSPFTLIDVPHIPMTDQRTIDDCKARIYQLDKMIENTIANEKPHYLLDLISEKRQIEKYLYEVTGKNGKIRFFKNEFTKLKDTIMKNIRRILLLIATEDITIADYLRKNLEIKKYTIKFK